MLHRLILSITLAILFAFGQQSAVVHEISHFADISGDLSSQQQKKVPHTPVCEKCLSFGELGSALSVHYFSPAIVASTHETVIFSSKHRNSVALLHYSARAPPQFV